MLARHPALGPLIWFSSLAGTLGLSIAGGTGLLLGIRAEFILFAIVLLGVALFHPWSFWIALTGLSAISACRFFCAPISVAEHLQHEWSPLVNVFGLLLGFAILARHFEDSAIPHRMMRWLPTGWMGPWVLLAMVFVLSSFLDNIAAAMIGGTLARMLYRKFDNIPLTKLALDQDGYNWALLAFSVGFGGSLTWFGSSAGVAITNLFPEARSMRIWLRNSWPILLGYIAGFLGMLAVCG